MDWREALEIRVQETGHEQYRTLCADNHPHHKIWRGRMVTQATNGTPRAVPVPVTQRRALDAPPALTSPLSTRPAGGCGCGSQPPSLVTQAGTAVAAAGRFIASGLKLASAEIQDQRKAVCEACDELDRQHGRCKICKCFIAMKIRLPAEKCPLEKWSTEVPPSG